MAATEPITNGAQSSLVIHTGAATPANEDDYTKLKDQFDKTVDNKIGAWVAALVALAVPVVTAFCAWVQRKIGIKLDPAELTAFIASMGAGIIVTAFKWLSNRGTWERSVVEAYQVYLTGQAATSNQIVVTPPAPQPKPEG
jgi:hypothetical protein